MQKIRIAVISDIHASVPKDGVAASYTSTASQCSPITRDAMLSLERLIKEDDIRADYFVCCGDMANQADPTAMRYAWEKFTGLSQLLCATPIATVGNHDLDSRLPNTKFDARGLLRGLKPNYPLRDIAQTHEFWSRNFVVLQMPGIRFVVLNSCAYHGYNPSKAGPEYEHGRVSDFTLADLRGQLESLPPTRDISILLCHHHPFRHESDGESDVSAMSGGERLIDLLSKVNSNTWMVIHGHRHQPCITHWGGVGHGPVIFSAGSFSAKLSGEIGLTARNQFYLIEFDPANASALDLDVAGTITAWDFNLGEGWEPAGAKSGMPASSGFGYQIRPPADAIDVKQVVDVEGGIGRWDKIMAAIPRLRFATPSSLTALAHQLKDYHGMGCTWSEHGAPLEFARFEP